MTSANEEFQMTSEELHRLEKAMKDAEFRKLLAEYAEEISNPENKKKYEEEIAQMENERGMDVKFVNPKPGFVAKTHQLSDGLKVFVNICQNEHIEKATFTTTTKKVGDKSQRGQQWQIPHSPTAGQEDIDKAGSKCMVYNVVFNPETYQRGLQDARFKKLLISTALEAIERQFDLKLDKENVKLPKLKFKGTPKATVIRTPKSGASPSTPASADVDIGGVKLPYPYANQPPQATAGKDSSGASKPKKKSNKIKIEEDSGPVTPKYTIVYRGNVDLQNFTNARDVSPGTRPKELVVRIDLPLLDSAANIDLDVFERQLVLECPKPAYRLDIPLSYPVLEDEGSAKFDKSKRQLVVTLPVIPAEEKPLISLISELEEAESKQPSDAVQNGLVTELVNGSTNGSEHQVDEEKHSSETATDTKTNGLSSNGTANHESKTENIMNGSTEDNKTNQNGVSNGVSKSHNDSINMTSSKQPDDITNMTSSKESNDITNLTSSKQPNDITNMTSSKVPDDITIMTSSGQGDAIIDTAAPEINGFAAQGNYLAGEMDLAHEKSVEETEQLLMQYLNQQNFDAREEETELAEDVITGFPCMYFQCPPYTYHQDTETVTFILSVSGVSLESVSLGFNIDRCYISFPGHPNPQSPVAVPDYALYVSFLDNCFLDQEKCLVDVGADNVVLTLQKAEKSIGLWDGFLAGPGEDKLMQKIFLTDKCVEFIMGEIEKQDPWAAPESTATFEVTSMTEEKLSVEVRSQPVATSDTKTSKKVQERLASLRTKDISVGIPPDYQQYLTEEDKNATDPTRDNEGVVNSTEVNGEVNEKMENVIEKESIKENGVEQKGDEKEKDCNGNENVGGTNGEVENAVGGTKKELGVNGSEGVATSNGRPTSPLRFARTKSRSLSTDSEGGISTDDFETESQSDEEDEVSSESSSYKKQVRFNLVPEVREFNSKKRNRRKRKKNKKRKQGDANGELSSPPSSAGTSPADGAPCFPSVNNNLAADVEQAVAAALPTIREKEEHHSPEAGDKKEDCQFENSLIFELD